MGRAIRILIVDDSEDDALLLERQLRLAGFAPQSLRVETAEAMEAALDQRAWDIVLSDFMMPQFTGLDAVKLLQEKDRDTPIIIVSGKIGEETAVDCVKAGASDYLMKDNLKRLGTAVERELREAENRRVRRKAEERLAVTDANFRRVIANSADGILIVTADGVIRFANPAAEVLFGRAAADMAGTTLGFSLGDEIEIDLSRPDGRKVMVEMRIVATDWEGAPARLATLRDVTRRNEALVALRRSEGRLQLLLKQIPCVLWTLDNRTRFTSFTGSELGTVGVGANSGIVGMTLREFFREEDPEFEPYAAARRALRGDPATYELDRGGRTFYSSIEPLRDLDNRVTGVIGVTLDITAQKQVEKQLRSLSRRLTSAQEKERRAIARELHDQVGQLLTALKLCLDKASTGGFEQHRAELEEARLALRELMTRVRSMSLELRPPMLDDLGLLPTLLWHFKRYSAQTGVQVQFRHRGLRRSMPADVITAAYRIVQEALTNVARHAKVDRVSVSVHAESNALIIEVEDRGAGFDVDRVTLTSSGVSGMRERALSLDGRLLVQSKLGEGTCVMAELPLRRKIVKRARGGEDD